MIKVKNFDKLVTHLNRMNTRTIYYGIMCFMLFQWTCTNPTSFRKVDQYYSEPHRLQFHFSPDSMWMNDPNGMVWYDGDYHLFYQYYPDSTVWGPMHWGHATSHDLLHWQHQPIAIYPDSLGLIFSGSAIIDNENTAGFGKDAMVAVFTHHLMAGEQAGKKDFQYQSIAYSNDHGRTFKKYDKNPVIANPGIKDFRDPKVIWHEQSKSWILVLAAYDKVMFYQSKDLKSWKKSSEFGIEGDKRLWECPDIFPLEVKNSHETKWVLIVSIQKDAPNGGTATSYFVGDFDGNTFKADPTQQKWLDYGKDNYALVTFANEPNNKRIGIGWMSNWQYAQNVPTERWRSAMTLPRELTLWHKNKDYIIKSEPITSIQSLLTNTKAVHQDLYKTMTINPLSKIKLKMDRPLSGNAYIRLSNANNQYLDIGYDGKKQMYYIDRRVAGINDFSKDFAGIHYGKPIGDNQSIDLTIYLDYASVELFADDGYCTMTEIFFPSSPFNQLQIGTNSNVQHLEISDIKGVWAKK